MRSTLLGRFPIRAVDRRASRPSQAELGSPPQASIGVRRCGGREANSASTVCPRAGCTQPGTTSASGASTKARRCARGWGRMGSGARRSSRPTAMMSRSSGRVALRAAGRRPACRSSALRAASNASGAISPTKLGDAVHVVRLAGGRDRRTRPPAREGEEAHSGQPVERGGRAAAALEWAERRRDRGGWRRSRPGSARARPPDICLTWFPAATTRVGHCATRRPTGSHGQSAARRDDVEAYNSMMRDHHAIPANNQLTTRIISFSHPDPRRTRASPHTRLRSAPPE